MDIKLHKEYRTQCLHTSYLNICYWNIHGSTSKIIGNKLSDSEFLSKISKCDVVCLSEIHSSKEVSIPGFYCIRQKIREKCHKGPKISGVLGSS